MTHLVRREALARVAEAIGLGRHLILSRAEAASGAASNPAILADACEAVIAAIYLDGGFEAASGFIERFWEPLLTEMEGPPRDPKTALQEWAQGRGLPLPAYRLVGGERSRPCAGLYRGGKPGRPGSGGRDRPVEAPCRGEGGGGDARSPRRRLT